MSAPITGPEDAAPNDSQYPGGENARGYRIAFTVWTMLFLLLIVVALLNYFGLLIHRMM